MHEMSTRACQELSDRRGNRIYNLSLHGESQTALLGNAVPH